jgi:hypothetical protein
METVEGSHPGKGHCGHLGNLRIARTGRQMPCNSATLLAQCWSARKRTFLAGFVIGQVLVGWLAPSDGYSLQPFVSRLWRRQPLDCASPRKASECLVVRAKAIHGSYQATSREGPIATWGLVWLMACVIAGKALGESLDMISRGVEQAMVP